MKDFKVQLSIVPNDVNNETDKRPRLYAIIEDHSTDPACHTAVQSIPLDGGEYDGTAAREFMRHVGEALLMRFEPSLAIPYKNDPDNAALIDMAELESRKLKWAEKFKTIQSTEP